MSNMHITQRNQYDRIELSTPSTGVAVKRKGRIVALNVVLCAIAIALVYAMIDGIDGWAHIAVIGGIVTTVVGTMMAVDPLRRG